jgi:nicotinate phosphoribosyltransferase
MRNYKIFLPLIFFILLFQVKGYSQFGIAHEIAVKAGPASFFTDYGERWNVKNNLNNAGYGIGISHYMNFAYKTDCHYSQAASFFTNHFRIRNELDYFYSKLEHFGPVLQVEANIIEAQIIETILLNLLNFQTLVATKASRIKLVSGERTLLDFGLRRAQGPGGYYATRAAIVGGFHGTSNVIAGRDFGIPVSGTMAHSFIQSYDEEITAFRDFAEGRPKDCVLLVDTYDTLKSGVPNAITVAKEMEERGQKLMAIRLDSGDLAYLSKQCRKMLDEAGLDYVKIAASNQLDENVIKSLLEQGARIDVFGVGTNLVIGSPDAALDGVYKLAYSHGKPRIKISESIIKVTLPHKKQVYRLRDAEGHCVGADLIALYEENDIENMIHPFEPYKQMRIGELQKEPLLQPVMENGENKLEHKSLQEIAEYSKNRLAELSIEYKRFNNPHIYKVGITEALKAERDKLIASYQK